jgi:N-hydroxyarylamine O-acetyltransferase
MDEITVTAYLERLGVERPAVLDAAALATLHRAHQVAVPFENLGIHLGERLSVAEPDLVEKIVHRRRGGFCYELNGLFAALLRTLGADVRQVAARVHVGEGRFGPPLDHQALVVRTPDRSGPWLVDVGFGANSVFPIALDSRAEQADPGGRFLVVDVEDGDLEVRKDDVPQYRVEPRARSQAEFAPMCWYQSTSPDSHFTRSLVCSRITDSGRITLSDGRTLVRTVGGDRSEQVLTSDAEVLAAYREHFGIVLDVVPEVRPPVVTAAGRAPR